LLAAVPFAVAWLIIDSFHWQRTIIAAPLSVVSVGSPSSVAPCVSILAAWWAVFRNVHAASRFNHGVAA
jgi:hypothetical protein